MSSIRTIKQKNFVAVSKALFEDPSLSFKAKGIAIYLLSKPDDWNANVINLQNNSTDGRDAVYSGIKELIDAGYMEKKAKRNEAGEFLGCEYVLYEIKTLKHPLPENLDTDKPDAGYLLPDNPPIINNNKAINNDLNKKDLSKSGQGALPEEFKTLYEAYPRHQKRKAALAAWQKIKGAKQLLPKMLAAVSQQRQEREWDKKYSGWCEDWPLLSSWLTGERWNDEHRAEKYFIAKKQERVNQHDSISRLHPSLRQKQRAAC